MGCGQRYVCEALPVELALTVSFTANEELGQGRILEEGADQEDFERYGYI